jgi:lipopolysaccharide transport system ATP-binding protein
MSTDAIEVTGLGKRYLLGEREQYQALRDVLSNAPRKLVGRVRKANGSSYARPHTWALRDVEFSVQPGEVLGIVGHNGAGKSTLLKILSRITRPTEGRAVMRGRIGSLLEVGSGFHPELTGAENILLNGAILGMSRSEVRDRFDEIVAFSGVEQYLQTPVKRYSTGMYMRLAFAVAAHLEPEILVIDEVLAVGDAEFQRKCIGRMNEMSRGHGRTVLFVSHNLDAVKQLCPRSIWLDHGHMRADGPTADVVSRYLEQHVATATAGSWIDMGQARRIGTGEVHIERARIDGTDDPQGLPHSGGGLRVGLVVNVHRSVKIGSLAVRVSIPGGPVLVVADPVIDADLPLELDIGIHRLDIEIESLTLSPGSYTIGLWLARGGGGRAWSVFDSIEDAIHLDLEAAPGVEPLRGQAVVPCHSTLTLVDQVETDQAKGEREVES